MSGKVKHIPNLNWIVCKVSKKGILLHEQLRGCSARLPLLNTNSKDIPPVLNKTLLKDHSPCSRHVSIVLGNLHNKIEVFLMDENTPHGHLYVKCRLVYYKTLGLTLIIFGEDTFFKLFLVMVLELMLMRLLMSLPIKTIDNITTTAITIIRSGYCYRIYRRFIAQASV